MIRATRRQLKHLRNWSLAAISLLIPAIAYLNIQFFQDAQSLRISTGLVLLLLADFVFGLAVVVFFGLVLVRRAVRRKESGIETPIQLRLSRLFAVMSLVSAVAVAIVATVTINEGIGGVVRIFISESVSNSRIAAQSYFDNELKRIRLAIGGLAPTVARRIANNQDGQGTSWRQILQQEQEGIAEKVDRAFLINRDCVVVARGIGSYVYDLVPPPHQLMSEFSSQQGPLPPFIPSAVQDSSKCSPDEFVNDNETWLITEPGGNSDLILGAVFRHQDSFSAVRIVDLNRDLFLLVTNYGSSPILNLHDTLNSGAAGPLDPVRQLGEAIIQSSIIYMAITLVVVFVMIGLSIALARRLSKPIEEFAAIAGAIEGGTDKVKVPVEGDDEVALLGRSFNQMLDRLDQYTRSLVSARDEAEESRKLAEVREQRFSSVLSNVTAGVIGLDRDRRIIFMNRSAGALLGLRCEEFNELEESYQPKVLDKAVPEFAEPLQALSDSNRSILQREVDISRPGSAPRRLLVRFAEWSGEEELVGFVIAFDDLTKTLKLEEQAGWAMAAQQIAHEIRNPHHSMLLSVQDMLDYTQSGEAVVERFQDSFITYLKLIQMNVANSSQLAESFAEYAKLPDPEPTPGDICEAIRNAAVTVEGLQFGVAVATQFDKSPIAAEFDENLLHSLLVNLLKNACEAVAEFQQSGSKLEGWSPQVRVKARHAGEEVEIQVMDNGPGFPVNNRNSVLTPFKSTKKKGSNQPRGLGLAYVERIASVHGGSIQLGDAPAFEPTSDHAGAMVTVKLPRDRALPAAPGNVETNG